jgi:hypothetical protein
MKYFDYIFYRIARAYHKSDGNESSTAFIAVGFMQGMIVSDLILFPLRFFYDRDQTSSHVGLIKIIGGIILTVFIILSYIRYKNMYTRLNVKWGNEVKSTRFFRGILVVIALFLPLVILILGGIYW